MTTPATPSRPDPDRPPALAPEVEARLGHLFRHSLRAGLVHPLHQALRAYRGTPPVSP